MALRPASCSGQSGEGQSNTALVTQESLICNLVRVWSCLVWMETEL